MQYGDILTARFKIANNIPPVSQTPARLLETSKEAVVRMIEDSKKAKNNFLEKKN